ncbi:MAG: S1C family serine protease [Gammaproteobacteria bacterium]
MLPRKFFIFLAQSAAVGIIAAAILIFLLPNTWLQSTNGDAHTQSDNLGQFGPFSYSDAVSKAAPAVVNIYTKKLVKGSRKFSTNDPQLERMLRNMYGRNLDRTVTSLGSGVIVTAQGHILTNNHVIENAEEIEVYLRDGRQLSAKVVGADPETDLAVLQIPTFEVPSITLGTSQPLAVGDVVLAIGNPFGLGQTVSQGIISATGRNHLGVNVFENYIQTDAAINPGNSGGALVNAKGELIGINTITSSKNGTSVGIGFAIPIELAKEVMAHMIEYGRVLRGWIGVRMQNISPQLSESFGLTDSGGVLVSGIVRGGPAHAAGLYPGDIIISMNDQIITDERQILNQVIRYRPQQELMIKGIRNGNLIEWKVNVGQRPIYGALTY